MTGFSSTATDEPRCRTAVAGSGSDSWRKLNGAADVYLSSRGNHLDPARAGINDPAFLFTPLVPPVDRLLVMTQTMGLFPNAFTAAWLGTLLVREEAREILIQFGEEPRSRELIHAIRQFLPATAIDEAEGGCIRLRPATGLAERVAALPTAYPHFHAACHHFCVLVEQVKKTSADGNYRYSMIGASRNSLVLDRLAIRLGWPRCPTLLDVGGGFGFLGVELATKGWNVTVADIDRDKTELVGPWLAKLWPNPLPLDYCTTGMEEITSSSVFTRSRRLDGITFFNSLYLSNRDRVGDLLRSCWQRLAPGGALVIREMIRLGERVDVHDRRFERDELISLVTNTTTAPSFVSIVDGAPVTDFDRAPSALVAVKPVDGKPLSA